MQRLFRYTFLRLTRLGVPIDRVIGWGLMRQGLCRQRCWTVKKSADASEDSHLMSHAGAREESWAAATIQLPSHYGLQHTGGISQCMTVSHNPSWNVNVTRIE